MDNLRSRCPGGRRWRHAGWAVALKGTVRLGRARGAAHSKGFGVRPSVLRTWCAFRLNAVQLYHSCIASKVGWSASFPTLVNDTATKAPAIVAEHLSRVDLNGGARCIEQRLMPSITRLKRASTASLALVPHRLVQRGLTTCPVLRLRPREPSDQIGVRSLAGTSYPSI